MITPKQIANKTMNEQKRAMAHNDYFAFFIGRPISYVFTIPFLYLNISPNTISLLSIIPLLVGLFTFYVSADKYILIIGWLMFFVWNIMDGIDGNVARYQEKFSKKGSVYDAMSGYIAMVFTFFAVGLATYNSGGILDRVFFIDRELYIVMGALSGIFVIFPRLIMHKTISTLKDFSSVNSVKDKANYSFIKIIALNISSVTGGAQLFMLISIILNVMDLYTIFYFIFNLLVMIVSLRSILKD